MIVSEKKEYEQETHNDYDLKTAAELLGVSTRTVRQRLIDGDLDGYKKQTKYGPKWYVPASEIKVEKATIDVVPLRKPISASEFRAAMKESLKAAIKERDQEMVDKLSEVMDQKFEEKLSAIEEELKQTRKMAEDRDKKLVELMRSRMKRDEENNKKGLWGKIKTLFGR